MCDDDSGSTELDSFSEVPLRRGFQVPASLVAEGSYAAASLDALGVEVASGTTVSHPAEVVFV
jgi:hypothetical protein